MFRDKEKTEDSYIEILRAVILEERIKTLAELKESSLITLDAIDVSLDQIFNENRRQRMYLLNQVLEFLYPTGTLPTKAIEVGSAGDVSLALTLNECNVTSVDIDPAIFKSLPYNSLPLSFFQRIGKKKSIEGYGGSDLMGRKKRKLKFVQETIPNWHYRIEDAEELSDKDSLYELAFVQGTPDMLEFLSELSRVIKPGGYIVSMVNEEVREGDYTSAYVQERYVCLPEYKFISDKELRKLKLERVVISDDLKQYEELSHFDDEGVRLSSGYVFEIFRSIKD